ncbi:MAG TPA: hypothetical protein VMW74_00100 [Nitrosopumilaceae archaeon]|nr:hypothetical protein [Nitrosopumilaceae archaeon]
MKNISKILLFVIPIVFILIVFVSDYLKEPEKEAYYKIGLSGIKEQYMVGEELTFSLFLNGYGSDCGSYEVQVLKDKESIEGRSIDIDCTKEISDDFEFINIDITTLTLILTESGTYTVTGEFSNRNGEKFQDKKTFTVI